MSNRYGTKDWFLPTGNWTTALAKALDNAHYGDVIVVHSDAMMELAKRAAFRAGRAGQFIFRIEAPTDLPSVYVVGYL